MNKPHTEGATAAIGFTDQLDRHIEHALRSVALPAADKTYAELHEQIMSAYKAGGKRLRPYLVWLAYSAFGGTDKGAAMHVAAGWELLHLSFLIQDDIIDEDLARHGKRNVAGYYTDKYTHMKSAKPQHFANGTSMIAASILMNLAKDSIRKGARGTIDEDSIHALYDLAISKTATGEILDYESDMVPIQESDPEETCMLKTSAYSTVGPLVSAAMLAGSTNNEALESYAKAIGYGFQLADDILGSFGDESKTGKSASKDIELGKRTLLLKAAHKAASGDDKIFLESLGRSTINKEEVTRARDLFQSTGAKKMVEARIIDCLEEAEVAVQQLEIKDTYKKELTDFARSLLHRSF